MAVEPLGHWRVRLCRRVALYAHGVVLACSRQSTPNQTLRSFVEKSAALKGAGRCARRLHRAAATVMVRDAPIALEINS